MNRPSKLELATTRFESAREAQTRAESQVTVLERDLGDLQQQVGPVVGLVEEARSNAQHGRNMSRQRQQMLEGLVRRARAVGDDLGIEVPAFAAGGDGDEAAYTFFFEEFLGKLEGVAKDFDRRVVEESRDLLIVATSRIFSNLARLHPSLDFEDATASADVTSRAWDAATAYAKKFDQVEVDEGEGDDEDGAEEEEAADGAGGSGGAQA